MVGHQYVGVDKASRLGAVFLQPFQIKEIIVLGKETGLPIVASLDDVGGNPWGDDSWSSWHGNLYGQNGGFVKGKRGLSPVFLFYKNAR